MEVSIPKSIGLSRYMRAKINCSIQKNKTTANLNNIFKKLKLDIIEIELCKKYLIDNIGGCKVSFDSCETIHIGKKITSDSLDDILEEWIVKNKVCKCCNFPEFNIKDNMCAACGYKTTADI